MIPALIIAFLFLGYAGLIIFYAVFWAKLKRYKIPITKTESSTAISIVIAARNEEENIEKLLRSILAQSYPSHLRQVIVVDDHSTDGTAAIVNKYVNENVLLLQLKDFVTEPLNSYKKKAIETALAHTTSELIITTDADCVVPPNWLATIIQFYLDNLPVFIAMPVVFTNDNSPLQIFQVLDFMTLQGITGASAGAGTQVMCNGANMAYTRAAFYEVNGFEGINNIASGDDMMLLHKIAAKFPGMVAFLKSPEVIVQTAPMPDLKNFLNQRIRWASKADKYDDKKITVILALVYLTNLALFIVPILCIFYNPVVLGTISLLAFWCMIIILKIIIELIFLIPVATFFKQEKLLWWFPFAQPFHILYTIVAGWLGKFGKYSWKGRTVK